MNKKIIGILVMTLLIGTALPAIGLTNENKYIVNYQREDIVCSKFVPGEFIVKFKDALNSCVSIDNLNEKYHIGSMEKVFKNSENTILDNIYIFEVPKDSDISSIVDDFSSKTFVEYAEPNYFADLFLSPNDENFSKQWALNNVGQCGGTPDADIDAPEAWDIETGSPDIVIAIVDTGIDYNHPDLQDNIWINEDEEPDNDLDDDNNGFIDDVIGWDFYYDDNEPLDGFGHGTPCSGIASAATNNDIGIAGVSWNCKIMPVQSFDELGQTDITIMSNGIVYAADNNADVISMSFGVYTYSELLEDAVDYAYSKGAVLIAAAGNIDDSLKAYPAAYENVIAVAATDNNDERAKYEYNEASNYGSWIDVAAPGKDVFTTMPTYMVTLNYAGFSMNYDELFGTSMACPHVAGLAGLILSKNPSYSQTRVRSNILSNVDPYDSVEYIGTGRINAYKALIEEHQPPSPPSITGEINGVTGNSYTYTFVSFAPDADDLAYYIEWDDGTTSGWTDFMPSGPPGFSKSHSWSSDGTYTIRAKAKDPFDAESDWTTLDVSMPRNRAIISPFLQFRIVFLPKNTPLPIVIPSLS